MDRGGEEELTYNNLLTEKAYAEGRNYKGMKLFKLGNVDIPIVVDRETWEPVNAESEASGEYELLNKETEKVGTGGNLEEALKEAEDSVGIYLTYEAGEGGNIQVETSQKVEEGGDGTEVTAIADEGYVFSGWSDGEISVTRSETNITTSQSYEATFKEMLYDEMLTDGYYVVSTYNSTYTEGCQSAGLPEANEKCILGIDSSGDNSIDFYVAPGSTNIDNKRNRDCSEENCHDIIEGSNNGEAASYCTNISAGLNDWYLPSKNELLTLQEKKIFLININSGRHWTSTYSSYGGGGAAFWTVNLSNGTTSVPWYYNQYYVRCIAR